MADKVVDKEPDALSESTAEASTESLSPTSSGEMNEVPEHRTPSPHTKPTEYDPNLWYIHGQSYDLKGFVPRHPGGKLAILSGRGRDCTALFESYHPWNDHHRRVLKAFGAAPPAPDPFYEELKAEVRSLFPGGSEEVRMPWHCMLRLLLLGCCMIWLFFCVRTPLACLAAGVLQGTIGTRLSHEGGHFQMSRKEWVNRLCMFLGYLPTGPSMAWHYRHVISHHAHTNQKDDVDVEYIGMADLLPSWLKILLLPFLPIGAVIEIGPKQLIDLLVLRSVGGNRVDLRIGGLLLEAPVWLLLHWLFGPSLVGYLCMYAAAGAIFVPCSQVAHAIVYPKVHEHHASWAHGQIAESCDFAADSEFWFHMAFGLTTQVEHHLFPGIGHHCYARIRHVVAKVCKKHGVHYTHLSAKEAFGALWRRWLWGELVMPLAA